MSRKTIIDELDAQEVAASICGIDSDSDEEIIETELISKFSITISEFQELLQALFEKLSLGISPLTESAMIGFSDQKDGHGVWLAKKEITPQFITAVLQWMGADDIEVGSRGVSRVITTDKKPEFEIIVQKADYSPWIDVKDSANKPKDGQLCLITKKDKMGTKFPECSFEEVTFLTKYYADKDEFTEYPTKSNRGIPHWGVQLWQAVKKP